MGLIRMSWFARRIEPKTVTRPEPDLSYFTPRAEQVLALARKEAQRLYHNFIGTERLLLGLIQLGKGIAFVVLQKRGVDTQILRAEIEKHREAGPGEKTSGHGGYTAQANEALSLARKEAKALWHTYIGTEHILLALLRQDDGVASRVLQDMQMNFKEIRQAILKELDPYLGIS
jgi:ATP-dependent Clp protease ATP-binding subunit ClpC